MDVNEALRRFRAAMEKLTTVRDTYANDTTGQSRIYEDLIQEAAEEAADAAADLDAWITRGGFLPDAWSRDPVERAVANRLEGNKD